MGKAPSNKDASMSSSSGKKASKGRRSDLDTQGNLIELGNMDSIVSHEVRAVALNKYQLIFRVQWEGYFSTSESVALEMIKYSGCDALAKICNYL
jgi:hypothetical protein